MTMKCEKCGKNTENPSFYWCRDCIIKETKPPRQYIEGWNEALETVRAKWISLESITHVKKTLIELINTLKK